MYDTIAAIATARGEGAIGIVRLSGDNALSVLNKIASLKKWTVCTQYESS